MLGGVAFPYTQKKTPHFIAYARGVGGYKRYSVKEIFYHVKIY